MASDIQQRPPVTLASALFSKTQLSVLTLLFGNPDRSYYTNEIILLAGGGSGAVQRELSRLVRSGLVRVKRIGSQKHYQVNPDSPIYSELCGIINKTAGLAEPIKSALRPFESDIDFAFVFGSVAKGADTSESDVDLMIISSDLSYADVYPVLEELSLSLGREVEPTIYTPDDLKKRLQSSNSFVERVFQQDKIWLLGKEDEFPAG